MTDEEYAEALNNAYRFFCDNPDKDEFYMWLGADATIDYTKVCIMRHEAMQHHQQAVAKSMLLSRGTSWYLTIISVVYAMVGIVGVVQTHRALTLLV